LDTRRGDTVGVGLGSGVAVGIGDGVGDGDGVGVKVGRAVGMSVGSGVALEAGKVGLAVSAGGVVVQEDTKTTNSSAARNLSQPSQGGEKWLNGLFFKKFSLKASLTTNSFAFPLNVVIILKTNHDTQTQAPVILFSTDLE
jgi:hypothetical protein